MIGRDAIEMFEGSFDPELMIDTKGRVITATDGYVRATLRSREELSGRLLGEVPPYQNGRPGVGA
jgi:hypothetical protein